MHYRLFVHRDLKSAIWRKKNVRPSYVFPVVY